MSRMKMILTRRTSGSDRNRIEHAGSHIGAGDILRPVSRFAAMPFVPISLLTRQRAPPHHRVTFSDATGRTTGRRTTSPAAAPLRPFPYCTLQPVTNIPTKPLINPQVGKIANLEGMPSNFGKFPWNLKKKKFGTKNERGRQTPPPPPKNPFFVPSGVCRDGRGMVEGCFRED